MILRTILYSVYMYDTYKYLVCVYGSRAAVCCTVVEYPVCGVICNRYQVCCTCWYGKLHCRSGLTRVRSGSKIGRLGGLLSFRSLCNGGQERSRAHTPPHALTMSSSWPATSHNSLLQAANVVAEAEHVWFHCCQASTLRPSCSPQHNLRHQRDTQQCRVTTGYSL